ncbi:hypothetical protein LXL04_007646 [Taraxacum kok-saghyz]
MGGWLEVVADNSKGGGGHRSFYKGQLEMGLGRTTIEDSEIYNVCFVNGYKFHTKTHAKNKSTMNSGVCISSVGGDYYEKLIEIFELEYPRYPRKTTILFKCHWYDPKFGIGVKVHKQYNFVETHDKRKHSKFELFVLAMQPSQVCYMSYPSLKYNSYWLAVFKVKPRGWTADRESDHKKDDLHEYDQHMSSNGTNNEDKVYEQVVEDDNEVQVHIDLNEDLKLKSAMTSDRAVCHSTQRTRVQTLPEEITTSSATQFPIKRAALLWTRFEPDTIPSETPGRRKLDIIAFHEY